MRNGEVITLLDQVNNPDQASPRVSPLLGDVSFFKLTRDGIPAQRNDSRFSTAHLWIEQ